MVFDELKSLFDIVTAAAPAFLSAIREVGKECGTPGGGCCGEGVEDPEGYGLTRPFTPKVHVPPVDRR